MVKQGYCTITPSATNAAGRWKTNQMMPIAVTIYKSCFESAVYREDPICSRLKHNPAVRGLRMIIFVENYLSCILCCTLLVLLSLYMRVIKEFALVQFLLFFQDKMHALKCELKYATI